MDNLSNASLLELGWLICAILVTVLSALSMRDALLDSRALKAAAVNGARRVASTNNIYQEMLRVLTGLSMIAATSFLMFIPDVQVPLPNAGPNYAHRIAMVCGILIAVLTLIGSALDRAMRRSIMEYRPNAVLTPPADVLAAAPDVAGGMSAPTARIPAPDDALRGERARTEG